MKRRGFFSLMAAAPIAAVIKPSEAAPAEIKGEICIVMTRPKTIFEGFMVTTMQYEPGRPVLATRFGQHNITVEGEAFDLADPDSLAAFNSKFELA